MVTATLAMPRVPIFDSNWTQTSLDVQDTAAAHLLYEDALEKRPDEVGGDAFLITGKWDLGDGSAFSIGDVREIAKV